MATKRNENCEINFRNIPLQKFAVDGCSEFSDSHFFWDFLKKLLKSTKILNKINDCQKKAALFLDSPSYFIMFPSIHR